MKKFLIRQRQENLFSVRVKSVGGNFSAEQLKAIYEVAKNFGDEVHLTARQEISIQSIKAEDFTEVERILSANNLKLSMLGAGLKNITACQGNKICPSGIIDTIKIARELENRHGEQNFLRKITIGLSGCKNNCMRVEKNNIGIKGAIKPIHLENCNYCGKCKKICPVQAISFDEKNFIINREICINCGRCIKVCDKFLQGEVGFSIYLDGKIFMNFIDSEEKLFEIVAEILKNSQSLE